MVTTPRRAALRRRSAPALPVLLGVLLTVAAAARPLVAGADVRVLLAFDAAGHRVHRVTRTEAALSGPQPSAAPVVDLAAAARAGDAVLVWRAADGRTLSLERVPDPRVGHAPAPGGDGVTLSPGAPVALSEGGWLARGPDAATELVIRLPVVGAPALAAEEWRLPLDR